MQPQRKRSDLHGPGSTVMSPANQRPCSTPPLDQEQCRKTFIVTPDVESNSRNGFSTFRVPHKERLTTTFFPCSPTYYPSHGPLPPSNLYLSLNLNRDSTSLPSPSMASSHPTFFPGSFSDPSMTFFQQPVYNHGVSNSASFPSYKTQSTVTPNR